LAGVEFVSKELIESSESQDIFKKVVASFMPDVLLSAEKNALEFYAQSMSRLNITSTSRSSRLRLNNKRNNRAHDEDEDEGEKKKKKRRTGGKDENEDDDGDDDNDIDVRKSQESNKRTKSKSKGGTNKKLKKTTHFHFTAYHTSVNQSRLLDEIFETGYMIPKNRSGRRELTMLAFMSIYAKKRNPVETFWVNQYAETLQKVKNQKDLLVKITFQDSVTMSSGTVRRLKASIDNGIKRLIIPILDSKLHHYAVLKVNIEEKECCIYNSLESVDMSIVAKNAFQYFLREENECDWSWTYIFGKQNDGWSCGLWCIMYMHCLVMEDDKMDEFITQDINERSLQKFAYAVIWNILVRDSILLFTDQRQISRVEFKKLFDTTADVFTTKYLASYVKVVDQGHHHVLFELDQQTQEAVTQLVADWKGNSKGGYTEKLASEVWSEIPSRCNMFVELVSGEVVKNDCEETDARVSGVVALVQVKEMAGTIEEEEPKGKTPLTDRKSRENQDRLKIGLAVLGEFLIITSS
jgi:hypothetical protein